MTNSTPKFIPGTTPIPASFPTWGAEEKQAMCDQINAGWLTAGPKNKEFEAKLAKRWGTAHAVTCNSGSSANLLAVGALVEAGKWHAGDEIICVAASFPTTINPLLQYGLVPVFVDVDPETFNATLAGVQAAVTPKTKGIMLAHTLGHPFPLSISGLAIAKDLLLIEDCCDAFGARWEPKGGAMARVGTRGDLATCSFFPAHHITTGEGGAVFTNSTDYRRLAESLASWGRDCYCDPGCENTCGARFDQHFADMPAGYDHKYTYTATGYNLKMTEVQAVCGLEQLKKVESFITARNNNWRYLKQRFAQLKDHLVLPTQQTAVVPSWFGFAFTLRKPGERAELQEYLATCKIGSRLLFAGNITRQPYMRGKKWRVHGSLENSDKAMEDTLWVGVWPGMTEEMMDYVAVKVSDFFA